jgi:hypothetical protein
MDRQELVRLFPDGKTMHIPADGKPLPGYQEAVADYKRRMASDDIQIASAGGGKRRGFFAMLFGGGADEDEDNSDSEGTPSTPATAAPAAAKQTAPEEAPAAQPAEVQVASVNAPIPMVRPSFGGQAAGSDMASALVSPSHSAAQDALNAALPGAEAGQQQQYVDLSSMSVPVPSLLAARSTNGGTELASTDPAAGSVNGELVGIPVPLERPAVAESLLASANADPDAVGDEVDQNTTATLSPAVIAALEERRPVEEGAPAPVPVNTAEQAIAAVAPQKAPPMPARPVQMAALAPAAISAHFNRAFATSTSVPPAQVHETGVAAGLPAKGARPSKLEAEVASASRATVRTEPKLTDKMISQWALTNARLDLATKPVKAPRFVSPALRAKPTAVYTNGFSVKTASIDPARFSGTAVNFLEVKKFDTVQ